MKKTTRKNLSKRLVKYGALSIALAGVANANGQIDYTDVDPDFVGNDTNIGLDLNNDGIDDFTIFDVADPAVGIKGLVSGNSFVGSQPSYIYPFALNSGDPISSGQTTWFNSSNLGTLNYISCYNGAGESNWCGVTDKYLGLRFQITGNTHYGWARLDVSLSGDSYTLKDYAYNTTPDEALNAGQQTLSIENHELSSIKVVAFDKNINLSNLPETTNYRVLSITGKTVLEGIITDNNYVIEARGIATGIYIIELTDVNSNKVLKKKIVL